MQGILRAYCRASAMGARPQNSKRCAAVTEIARVRVLQLFENATTVGSSSGSLRGRGETPAAALGLQRALISHSRVVPGRTVASRQRGRSHPMGSLKMPLSRVAIVGCGFGGLFAARALRRAPVEVLVIDRNNYHLFQPLLYQVASAALAPADIAQPIRTILRGQKNASVMLGEVSSVDLKRSVLRVGDAEVPYDYLILAPGAVDNYFGHPDWQALAPGMKEVEEA